MESDKINFFIFLLPIPSEIKKAKEIYSNDVYKKKYRFRVLDGTKSYMLRKMKAAIPQMAIINGIRFLCLEKKRSIGKIRYE